ncbi:hypothetical protein SEA_BAXTERFOX_36 [Gordonia phage BaxterFox]|uniref:Uncharacterized protein n=1 Tax=Gordonia phage BaxterFox TaxID=1821549 RepID=A0A142KCL3_9CAUD|nr:hypothetical protein SEA_BAXTERFOX_36 [Gordonia phage BaxterFox]AMS03846.1 hypothetical protein SEA_BAXTERFOX_36 [Gordonia phage BaxterFox]
MRPSDLLFSVELWGIEPQTYSMRTALRDSLFATRGSLQSRSGRFQRSPASHQSGPVLPFFVGKTWVVAANAS